MRVRWILGAWNGEGRGVAPPEIQLPGAIAFALFALLAGCGNSSNHSQSSGSGTTGAGSAGSIGSGNASGGAGTTAGAGVPSGAGAGSVSGTPDAGPDGTLSSGSPSGGSGSPSGSSGSPSAGSSGASSGAATGSTAPTGATSGAAQGGGGGVYTNRNDLARTGANPNETILTPANVDMGHFGKKFSQPVDGWIYAQPLLVLGVSIPNKGTHNVVYVATENDSVYAFDGDTKQPALWQVNFLSPGVTTVPAGDPTGRSNLQPVLGITGTPVIDPATSTLYVVAKTKVTAGPTYYHHLHALDLATGAEKLGGPIAINASVPGTGKDAVGGMVTLNHLCSLQGPGLGLAGGVLTIVLSGQDNYPNWHGWVLGYDATTLAQKFAYNTTPDGNAGSIWQSRNGIAIDPQGNLYVETGNGTFDAMSGGRDLSMSVVKLSATGALVDWFAPHDEAALSNGDADLGSTGPVILPDQTGPHPHLMIGSGKPGYLYLLDRDQMGHFNAADDSQIVQKVTVRPNTGDAGGMFATPVYWNGYVYTTAAGDPIKAFSLSAGVLSTTPVSQTTPTYSRDTWLAASSNGATGGILWAVQLDGYTPTRPAVLHAYDATDLTKELYNSGQAPGMRDQAGPSGKFDTPTIANGHVYLQTQTELDVFGEL